MRNLLCIKKSSCCTYFRRIHSKFGQKSRTTPKSNILAFSQMLDEIIFVIFHTKWSDAKRCRKVLLALGVHWQPHKSITIYTHTYTDTFYLLMEIVWTKLLSSSIMVCVIMMREHAIWFAGLFFTVFSINILKLHCNTKAIISLHSDEAQKVLSAQYTLIELQ